MIRHASRPITLGLAAAFTIVLAADSAAQSRDKNKRERQRRAVTQNVKRVRAERQSVRKTTLRAKEVRSSSPRIRVRTRNYREVRTDVRRPVIQRPETRRPEIRRPEIRRPEIRRPEIRRPEVRRPEVRRPEVRRPEVRRPEVRRPEVRRPDVRRPEIRRPEVRRPEPRNREARPGRQVREVRPNDRLRVRPEWKATSGGSSRIHVRSRDGRRGYGYGYGYGRHGVRRHRYDHYCHIHRRYVPFSHFGHHHRPFRFGHHSAFGGFGFHTGHWHFVIAINLPIGHRHHHHYVSHRWWDGHRSSLYTWDRARAVRTVSTAGPAYYDFTGETCVSLRLTTRDGELHELQIDPRYYEAKDPGDLYAALWGQLERDGRLELQDLDGVIYVFPAGLLQEIEAAPCY